MTDKEGRALPRVYLYQNRTSGQLAGYLRSNGFAVTEAGDETAAALLEDGMYDICILDHFGSPSGDLRLLDRLRAMGDGVPAVMLSASPDSGDIAAAFDAGADDYVVRPFDYAELVWRLKAILRRTGVNTRVFESSYRLGALRFDVGARTLTDGEVTSWLSARETTLLALLCTYPGQVLTYKFLTDLVWRNGEEVKPGALGGLVNRVRARLRDEPRVRITSERGVGFRLDVDTA